MLSLLRSSPLLATAGVSATRCSRCFSHSSASYRDMTRITISGRLFGSPELSVTSTGRQCIRYTVRSWKGKEKTNFFNFMCFTDNANSIKYLTELPPGTKVVASGEFSPYQLVQQDGTKVSKYSIFSCPSTLHVIERGDPNGEVAGEDARTQPAGEDAQTQPAGEDARTQPAGEDAQTQPAGEDAQTQPAGEDAQTQPAGEDAQTQPAGEDAQTRPAPAPAEGGETPEHQAPN